MLFQLEAFRARLVCEKETKDAVLETEVRGNTLDVSVCAKRDQLKFVELEWDFACSAEAYVLGDAWERTYGDVTFRKMNDQQGTMPWYFMVAESSGCTGFGVKTQPNAFVGFSCTNGVIKAVLDCRNGGSGVELKGRKLHLATFVLETYESPDAFACLCDYCKKLCDHPILPKEKIYGGNNWYYAYGKSSCEQIVSDAKFQAELAKGIDNQPFEVVDDCWQIHSCAGPWLPNEQFGDMKKLADDIRAAGARPGLWVRLLRNHDTAIRPLDLFENVTPSRWEIDGETVEYSW